MSKDSQSPTYSYKELLTFLEQPRSYPHKVEEVEHIQTHISHVFLTDSFVYKLKKPVDLGFLDYSTLQKRKKLCHREVELNRRLSDDIYLGVIGFVQKKSDKFILVDDLTSDGIVEYAVKMKRLPDAYFLHRIVENKELTRDHLDRIADTLATFYLDQKNSPQLSKWGEIDAIKVNTDENFHQTEQFIGSTINRSCFEAIRYFTNRYFQDQEQLFQKRIETGRIVDGHGDLHLEHIHITPKKVQVYDCIEFNERFRYGDLAADLAFLAMDLDFNNCWEFERYFVDQMTKRLEDGGLHQIIDFYKCYRAYVKGKVKSLQSAGDEVPAESRERSSNLAKQYFKLSLRYALMGSKPRVIIFMGRIGTGKSTLADYLSKQLDMDCYSSDKIRKSLAGLPVGRRSPKSKRKELYTSETTSKTYRELMERAIDTIRTGKSVIVDATFSSEWRRQIIRENLEEASIPCLFVEVQASDKTIIERLQAREGEKEIISDARLEDFDKLTESYQSPAEIDDPQLVTVNTDQSRADSEDELYKKLVDIHLKSHLLDA